jgi:hypothetical protein
MSIAAPKGLHALFFMFSPLEKSATAFFSVVRSWQERSPGLSLFLPCATTQRAGKGVKDDEHRATARQATSTRRDERRRADGERQLRRAIAAEGRLSDRRIGRSGRIGHEPDPRFAYLTRLHD